MKNENEDFDSVVDSFSRAFLYAGSIRVSPDDPAVVFINIDPLDREAVKKFCIDLQFTPPKLPRKTFIECFKEEQDQVKRILLLSNGHNLEQKDLDYINLRLEGLKKESCL